MMQLKNKSKMLVSKRCQLLFRVSGNIFTIKDETMTSLGYVSKLQPLVIEGNSIALGSVKRYTGIQVYNRPQEPLLVLGSLLMLVGLVWHFYFRHRKPGHKEEENSQHV